MQNVTHKKTTHKKYIHNDTQVDKYKKKHNDKHNGKYNDENSQGDTKNHTQNKTYTHLDEYLEIPKHKKTYIETSKLKMTNKLAKTTNIK